MIDWQEQIIRDVFGTMMPNGYRQFNTAYKDVLEGRKIDPTFYPVIYGAEEDDDWTDPVV